MLVIDRKEESAHFARTLREGYARLEERFATTVARTIIRFKRGAETVSKDGCGTSLFKSTDFVRAGAC